MIGRALKDLGRDARHMQGDLEKLVDSNAPAGDPRWLDLYTKACLFRHRPNELKQVNVKALRLAVEDLVEGLAQFQMFVQGFADFVE